MNIQIASNQNSTEERILNKLRGLKILNPKITEIENGPIVTGYALEFNQSTPIANVLKLNEDLALACGVESVDIQRIGNKVWIFVPNEERKVIDFKDALFWYLKDEKVREAQLPLLLGTDFKGEKQFLELSTQPHLLIAGSTGSGKAQPVEELVITPTGTKTIGELQVGDFVIGLNGKHTKVIAINPQGFKKIVKVTFSDNSSVECCIDHLWMVQDRNSRIKAKNEWHIISTKDLMSKVICYGTNKYKNYTIPIVYNPIEFESQTIEIDPYLLGILLGDGGIKYCTPILTSADTFIINAVREIVKAYDMRLEHDGDYGYRIRNNFSAKNKLNELVARLKNLGLYGLMSHRKFTPNSYKFNSVEVRLAVLQGLMDTDGTVTENGSSVYNTSSEQLANDVKFIVQSLGGTVKITTKIPTYRTLNDKLKKGIKHYTIYVCLPSNINPFRLPRKANAVIPKSKYRPIRYISSIEEIGEKDCICITVENENGLYLTKDCIVTHNSVFESNIIASLAMLKDEHDLILYLVDTKRLDLTLFEDLPQVAMIAKDIEDWYLLINSLVGEVSNRNYTFEKCKVRNIQEYNQKQELDSKEKMPYIVLVIDELADLIEHDKDFRKSATREHLEPKVIDALRRLIQICRASGVHIIACTQRTSVDVITGIVKTNFPTRISLKLPSSTDSRTILDSKGAENLLGKGDMLLKSQDSDNLKRFHSPFVNLEDVKMILEQKEMILNSLGG